MQIVTHFFFKCNMRVNLERLSLSSLYTMRKRHCLGRHLITLLNCFKFKWSLNFLCVCALAHCFSSESRVQCMQFFFLLFFVFVTNGLLSSHCRIVRTVSRAFYISSLSHKVRAIAGFFSLFKIRGKKSLSPVAALSAFFFMHSIAAWITAWDGGEVQMQWKKKLSLSQ